MHLAAEITKRKARELGADLVGIASARTIQEHPVPGCRFGPEDILTGAKSVVVLGRKLLWGMSRERNPRNRNVHYAGEMALSAMEELTYELVRFLEEEHCPSIMTPSAYSRSHQIEVGEKALSLPHVAVEAGLGTLGLNLQLLTPEYGPRVILGALITTAELEPDRMLDAPLCLGEECGRCLLACPGDAISAWSLDLERCRPHSSPYGYHFLQQHVERALDAPDPAARFDIMRSSDTLMIWQSMLRGVGIYTGCTRCYDVCPVGAGYETHLEAIQSDIPEETPEKQERLALIRRQRAQGAIPVGLRDHARWIRMSGGARAGDEDRARG